MRRLLLPLLLLVTTATAADRFDFSYVYKHGEQAHLRSNGMTIDSVVRVSKRWAGDFVWLRREGRAYLIKDAGVLASVQEAFADMHALEPRLEAAEERRRPVEEKMSVIEERMDRISDQLGDERLSEGARERLEGKLREAERDFRAIEVQHGKLEREAEQIEREMERLEGIAEERFGRIVLRAIEQGRASRVD